MAIGIFIQPHPGEMEESISKKRLLFISYSNDNYDKVILIKRELLNHSLFEPLIIADSRKPNSALCKLVSDGIDSAHYIIPILSPQSYQTQWINQEIGYSIAKEKPIIPVVESTILNVLKGFIHKQNQCPYSYTARLNRSDENKSFMSCFRALIKDLENEIIIVQQASAREMVREANRSLLPLSQPEPQVELFSHLRKPIGTIARTGEKCPENGIWKTGIKPTTSISFAKGTKFPPFQGGPIIWKLVRYN